MGDTYHFQKFTDGLTAYDLCFSKGFEEISFVSFFEAPWPVRLGQANMKIFERRRTGSSVNEDITFGTQ